MNVVLASTLAFLAVLIVSGGAHQRLARLLGPGGGAARVGHDPGSVRATSRSPAARGPVPDDGRPVGAPRWAILGAAALAGLGIAVLIGGSVGWLFGPLLGAVIYRVLRDAEPAAVRERRQRMEADLPMTIDVFAACLSAGASPERALHAIASADDGPLAGRLAQVAEQLRGGADPRDAWSALPAEPRVAGLGVFERAMARSADSGIPLVAVLDRLADDVRSERRAAADQRARSVGVRAAAPLGLCFLPAFVLVCIVPMVAASLRVL